MSKSNYKKLGKYIREVNNRDTNLSIDLLLGVSIEKIFKPSIANIIGTDMSTYKIVKRNQFAYGPVTSRNGDKISIALLEDFDEAIVSQAYTPFEIIDTNELLPEYLMMWFRRPEFDRYSRFMSHGSAREIFGWDEMCGTELPVPPIDIQREIVKEYNTIVTCIKLNEQVCQKLEETVQTIYKSWFVDFEFPNEEGNPYKSSGGEMEFHDELEQEIPKGWGVQSIDFFIATTIGGDWGESELNGNYTKVVTCIRGADIPNFKIGQLGNSPKRYILPQNFATKVLTSGQIVIEISGGSPTQSTGRTSLILDDHLQYAKNSLICSNFCRALSLKDTFYSGFIYSFINYLYKGDVLFNYENSTIGLKNFDINGFLSQQKTIHPSNDVIKMYNDIYFKILKSVFNYGMQNELLNNNHNFILSNLLLTPKEQRK